jgi:hypothetical protein
VLHKAVQGTWHYGPLLHLMHAFRVIAAAVSRL